MSVVPDLKGLVLAGGDSRRMGADKAGVLFAGQTLLDRAVQAMQPVVGEVFVSARAEQQQISGRSRYLLINDTVDARGPAAGILSAHRYDESAAWLVLACDLPLVNADVLEQLVRQRDASADATAWSRGDGKLAEPLCTVYEPATLAGFLHHVLDGGKPSPQEWLTHQQVRLLGSHPGNALAGVNTQQELMAIRDRNSPD